VERKASEFVKANREVVRVKKKWLRNLKTKWKLKTMEEGGQSSKSLWRDIGPQTVQQEIMTLEVEGKMVTQGEEIKTEVHKYIQKLGQISPETINTEDDRAGNIGSNERPEGESEEVVSNQITVEEYEKALRELKNGIAVGWDDIPNEFLKNGGEGLNGILISLFNACKDEEWTPQEWAAEKLKLLHKGKKRTLLDNYRGISIGSNVGNCLPE
jgi:hypothetical protein